MKTKKSQLHTRRRRLMERLNQMGPWLEGSLVETVRYCGKESCACHREGKKHPVLFVTGKHAGKTVSLYVPRRLEALVKTWAKNYKTVKELIRAVSQVQKEFIKLREEG